MRDRSLRPHVVAWMIGWLGLLSGCDISVPIELGPSYALRCPAPDARIPADVPNDAACEWVTRRAPDGGYREVLGWVDVLARDTQPSTVEIDWLRVHACVRGRDTLLWSTDFDPPAPEVRGGTWPREPWFGAGLGADAEGDLPYALDPAGYLVLHPASRPASVLRVESGPGPRPLVPALASVVWSEARVRITGPACARVGHDFWTNMIFNQATPAAQSDWGFDAADWETLRVHLPCP